MMLEKWKKIQMTDKNVRQLLMGLQTGSHTVRSDVDGLAMGGRGFVVGYTVRRSTRCHGNRVVS